MKEKESFNNNHPELKEGEVLLTNMHKDNYKKYEELSYKLKRKGSVAYDIFGNVIENHFPVFVGKEELENNLRAAGLIP